MIRFLLTLLPLAAFLLFWQWSVSDDTQRQFLFASPVAVWNIAVEELPKLSLWQDAGVTLLETILGLAAGTLIGTSLGLLLWMRQSLAWLVRPYLIVLGALPIFALAPMLIIWFGTGLLSKIVMAGFAVLFVALLQTYEGADATDKRFNAMPRALGASGWRYIRLVILPGAWQWVLTGFKLNVGLALVGAFIGEFVSAERGLGHYIIKAGSLYDTPRVILGLILMSAMALALTSLASLLNPHKRA